MDVTHHRRGRLLAAAVAVALAAALPAPARACSVCGCGDPLLAVSDPAAINEQLRLQFSTELLRVDAGTEGRPGSIDHLTQWSTQLNAAYRPIDALSFFVTVPLVSKKIETDGAVGSDVTGLGDVEIGGRYALWSAVNVGKRRAQELAVSAGTSIPTGPADARTATGELLDPHGQLGTGGWGPFVGLHYLFEQGDWIGFASASYRVRTDARHFDGSHYDFGDAALWSAHGQYRPVRRLALDLGIDGRYARADRAVDPDGTVTSAVENTGGTVVSFAPGAYVNAAGPAWLFVRGQVPFAKRLYGVQDVKPSVTAGIQVEVF